MASQGQRGSGWGVWNGQGVPGLNRGGRGRGNISSGERVSRYPQEQEQQRRREREIERERRSYPCKLPASYGQGVYEETPAWVDLPPTPRENEKDEDYEWGDPKAEVTVPQQYCQKVLAGPNCSHFLAPGETMEQCPYDKGHQVLTARFLGHLAKCRNNYITAQRQRGRPIEMEVCLYDTSHHIRIDEMEEHIKVCSATIKYRKEIEQINNAPISSSDSPNNSNACGRPSSPVSTCGSSVSADLARKRQLLQEDDWEKTAIGKAFNPVEKLAKEGTLFFCPQGLTKAERTEFRRNEKIRTSLAEEREKRIAERKKRQAGLGDDEIRKRGDDNDRLIADLDARIEKHAEIFKAFVYRTRPSDNWMDDEKAGENVDQEGFDLDE